jgi:hypothetical protein
MGSGALCSCERRVDGFTRSATRALWSGRLAAPPRGKHGAQSLGFHHHPEPARHVRHRIGVQLPAQLHQPRPQPPKRFPVAARGVPRLALGGGYHPAPLRPGKLGARGRRAQAAPRLQHAEALRLRGQRSQEYRLRHGHSVFAEQSDQLGQGKGGTVLVVEQERGALGQWLHWAFSSSGRCGGSGDARR